MNVGERLPVVVSDDVAGFLLLGRPRRREVALRHERARCLDHPAQLKKNAQVYVGPFLNRT
jgi:hypothetical protein